MGSSKPQPVKAPFEQQQQQQNTYQPFSIAETPLGQEFKFAKLDFGDPTDVDPGVAQRTNLAEQEEENRSNSAFNTGTPRFLRQQYLGKNLRDIRSQGAYEAQNAQYLNQQGNNARRGAVTTANLGRLERLLPQILQTGGSSNSSGYNTQVVQPQPGFWQRLALGAVQGGAQGAASMFGGG